MTIIIREGWSRLFINAHLACHRPYFAPGHSAESANTVLGIVHVLWCASCKMNFCIPQKSRRIIMKFTVCLQDQLTPQTCKLKIDNSTMLQKVHN